MLEMPALAHRPDVLYLAHRVPFPPDKGDRIRSYHVLRFLARRARVHLGCFADEPVTERTKDELNALCAKVAILPIGGIGRWTRALASFVRGRTITEGAFYSPDMRALVREWCRQTCFHAALASASSMAPYLQQRGTSDVPAVIDLMDVDSQKWLDYAASRRWPRSWLFRKEGRRLRKLESALPQWARAATLVSDAEADIFRSFCPWSEARAIANGVDLDYFQPCGDNIAAADCVFIGALDYYPNVDAAVWFCRGVWTEIHRHWPHAQFFLVGRRPVAEVRRLAQVPGVVVVPDVPDVRPYLSRATVALIPLRIARGLQNKVLEALAMGKAVVASPPAIAALKVQPGEQLFSASTPQEWVRAIGLLFEDSALRSRLGAAGRRFCKQHHDWDRCLKGFHELLDLPPAADNVVNGSTNPTVAGVSQVW